MATPATQPTTIPAILPPEIRLDFSFLFGLEPFLSRLVSVGLLLIVFVTSTTEPPVSPLGEAVFDVTTVVIACFPASEDDSFREELSPEDEDEDELVVEASRESSEDEEVVEELVEELDDEVLELDKEEDDDEVLEVDVEDVDEEEDVDDRLPDMVEDGSLSSLE